MTSDLCEEDVVRISSPQILSTDTLVAGLGAGSGMAVGAAPGPSRVQASSAAVELGRRLLLAARAGDTATVLDLMAKGAPFTTDWLGTSPLHLAAANAHVETCAVLLRAGVSRDSRTKVERTPLHLAAHAGHADVVSLLLDHGAIVDCRDMLRMTPLHWAASCGHAAAARVLLRRGADVRARCKFRHTPRELAARRAHRDLAALLERAEAEATAHDVAEQMAEEAGGTREIDSCLAKPTEIKIEKPKPKLQQETLKQPKLEPKVEQHEHHQHQQQQQQQQQQQATASSAAAAQLLRKHGITLLPTDDGSTVLNAIQSGRTVVLSDAGKLMLKESGGAGAAGGAGSAGAAGGGGAGGKGVLLTATPVRSPPQGVKIFTLNNKLLLPGGNKIPVKKVINPHDLQQMKFVQLSSEAKAPSPARAAGGAGAPLKAKTRLKTRPAVKIIVNKNNFNKLLAAAPGAPAAPGASPHDGHEMEGAEGGAEDSRQLRAQLAAAHAALADVAAELRACKDKLRAYEEGR